MNRTLAMFAMLMVFTAVIIGLVHQPRTSNVQDLETAWCAGRVQGSYDRYAEVRKLVAQFDVVVWQGIPYDPDRMFPPQRPQIPDAVAAVIERCENSNVSPYETTQPAQLRGGGRPNEDT